MKKLVCLVWAAVFIGCLTVQLRAEALKIGAKFPVEKLSKEQKTVDATIIAFMPSLTYDCDYASMLTQSFYYYFDRQMAFEGLKKSPTVRIYLIVRDKADLFKSTQNIFGTMTVIYDPNGERFSAFEVKQPAGKNADSTVVLLDAENNVAHIDENYRAQGERLKPLENKLRDLNGIYERPQKLSQKPLKIGDRAPDFQINERERLFDLRGKVVLISFYPAAFSGALPKPAQLDMLKSESNDALQKWEEARAKTVFDEKQNLMSCVRQTILIDSKPRARTEARRIVISSSTGSLLREWQKVLGTQNIEYANDPDYSVSLKYLSYNARGYNNRVSVIVDKKGKIAYIDPSFDAADEAILNAEIEKLLKK